MISKNTFKLLNPKSLYSRVIILLVIIVGLHLLLGKFSNKCIRENLDLPVSKKEKQEKLTEKLLLDINNAKNNQDNMAKKLGY